MVDNKIKITLSNKNVANLLHSREIYLYNATETGYILLVSVALYFILLEWGSFSPCFQKE